MKQIYLFMILMIMSTSMAHAQVGINADNSAPVPSAMLDVKSTTKGLLPPRMTGTQRDAIAAPATGLIVWCSNCSVTGELEVYNGSGWRNMIGGEAAFACGTSFTINHVAGTVAPVNKTTTYGTVTNIPGEPAKCWITSNLGSDHQATSVSDATEASAGWYWQFNHKQGYKHDGIIRTPNTTWISGINETSDWITTVDPCNIELGTTWRLPTYSEWYNVDNTGGWDTWAGPWDSGLKLHAAGFLDFGDGLLMARSSFGNYWSSSQLDAFFGRYLYFHFDESYMVSSPKAYGFSVRCLRNY